VVAKCKADPCQFGALAAARIDEVERGFACHAMTSALTYYGFHAGAPPFRRIYHIRISSKT
jgi:hypothetical protein